MFYGYVNIIRISHGDVSAFLVHQLVSLWPPVVLLVPFTRASAAPHVGIGMPCAGPLFPIAWAIVAQHTGYQCPRGGLRMPVWWAQADQPEGIERSTDELKKQTHHNDLSWLYWHNHRTSTGEIGLKKPMRLQWYINETSRLKNREVSFLLLSYISSI